ncbi:MAG: DUF4215 domain-containing protein, partial [Deltaproteobacteria bacterium]|nr:DUF4215 domain-containing protein [Deltaproteobacteria bacterium]
MRSALRASGPGVRSSAAAVRRWNVQHRPRERGAVPGRLHVRSESTLGRVITAACLLGGLATVATGCAVPEIVSCADGRVCPLGTICVAAGCAAPGCGDNDVDAFFGEECDDGNQTAGDGCSLTCRIESCGNGVLDPSGGEQCDDAGHLSHDGCSSRCLTEVPTWRELVDAGGPRSRLGAAAAWDPDRGRGFMHGGRILGVDMDEL